ncbi:MAG: ABC transporter ATP-binding protein, partial [Streptococcus parasanguinis]|nr:ABC transporter ATP-binding protein [Streptococcus parasanguinis]
MSQKRSSYVKRLFRDFAHHPGLLILASLGTIAQVALTVWLPILIGHAVDLVINPQGMTVLWPVLIQMVLVIVANTLIQWINPLVYHQLVYRFSQSLRAEVMEKVHRLPLSYLDKQGSGDFVSRLTTDVEQLNSGLLMVFNQFFVGLLTILVTIVTMAELDFFMMVAVLVLTPLSLLIARFIAKRSYTLFQKQTKARGLQTQLIEESLTQES